jgi:hypothetical protein
MQAGQMDSIEIDASAITSTVGCVFVGAIKVLPSRCLVIKRGIHIIDRVKVKVTLRLTVSQSVSQYVSISSPFWFSWPDVCYCWWLLLCLCGALSLWWEVGSVDCQSQSAFLSLLSVQVQVFAFQMFNVQICVYTLYLRPLSVRAQYSNLCPTDSSTRCHGSLRHLNGRTGDRRQA